MRLIGTFLLLAACGSETSAIPDPSGAASSSNTGAGGSPASSSSGTGGVDQAAADWTSGSRLRVRRLAGDDGTSVPLGLLDTTTELPCSFAMAEDGERRCLPVGVMWSGDFADEACSRRVAWVGTCPEPQAFALEALSLGCADSRMRVYRVATSTPPGERAYVYRVTDAGCEQEPPKEGYYVSLNEPADAADFVRAVVTTD